MFMEVAEKRFVLKQEDMGVSMEYGVRLHMVSSEVNVRFVHHHSIYQDENSR